MSAVLPLPRARRVPLRPVPRLPKLALLGTGGVGAAFVERIGRLQARGIAVPEFAWLSNSRVLIDARLDAGDALRRARVAGRTEARHLPPWAEAESLERGDVLVDATASATVADRHAEWLARGIHVVTANKLGRGDALERAREIDAAARSGHARYCDAATVGAGLPVLAALRALVAGGDRIHAIEGVLSGTLAWLLDAFDGSQPFSQLVVRAQALGITEPDPHDDLSCGDVRRKLLVLARAAGFPIEAGDIAVQPLLAGRDARLESLDAPMQARLAAAQARNETLCVVARIADGRAEVGLRALPTTHPLCAGRGADNRVALHSDRYADRPLVVQGPGAGTEVTAAALLDAVLEIACLRVA